MPHIHEKIDYAADILVVNGDAVLLRMHDKYHVWLAPGGHVELDEDMVEAALRETREETGILPKLVGDAPSTAEDDLGRELFLPRYINRHRVSDTHEHISFIYFGTSDTRELNPAPGEKTDGFKWFTRDELDDPQYGVSKRIAMYAKAALDAATK